MEVTFPLRASDGCDSSDVIGPMGEAPRGCSAATSPGLSDTARAAHDLSRDGLAGQANRAHHGEPGLLEGAQRAGGCCLGVADATGDRRVGEQHSLHEQAERARADAATQRVHVADRQVDADLVGGGPELRRVLVIVAPAIPLDPAVSR